MDFGSFKNEHVQKNRMPHRKMTSKFIENLVDSHRSVARLVEALEWLACRSISVPVTSLTLFILHRPIEQFYTPIVIRDFRQMYESA